MIRKLPTVLLLFLTLFSYSQEKVQAYFGVTQSIHTDNFMESNFMAGISFPRINETFSIMAHYSFNGNLEMMSQGQKVPLNFMSSHLLGLGFKHRLLTKSSFYSPTIAISFQTEIASDYIGGFVNDEYQPEISAKSYKADKWLFYHGAVYMTTPLVGRLLLGNEFRISNALMINLGFGFSSRAYKTELKRWGIHDDNPGVIKEVSSLSSYQDEENIKWKFSFDMSLGLNYALPSKNSISEKRIKQ